MSDKDLEFVVIGAGNGTGLLNNEFAVLLLHANTAIIFNDEKRLHDVRKEAVEVEAKEIACEGVHVDLLRNMMANFKRTTKDDIIFLKEKTADEIKKEQFFKIINQAFKKNSTNALHNKPFFSSTNRVFDNRQHTKLKAQKSANHYRGMR